MSSSRKRDRLTASTENMDPAVRKVHKDLEATLAHFMASVGDLCRTYDGKLREAMPFNPKAKFFVDDVTAATPVDAKPTTPLLLRPRSLMSTPVPISPRGGSFAGSFPLLPAAATRFETADTDDAPAAASDASVTSPPSHKELLRQLGILKIEARNLSKTLDQIHD